MASSASRLAEAPAPRSGPHRADAYRLAESTAFQPPESADRRQTDPDRRRSDAGDRSASHQLADWSASANATTAELPPASAPPGDLNDELAAIRRQLARLARGQPAPHQHLGDLAEALAATELPEEIIAELDLTLDAAGDRVAPDRRHDLLSAALARRLDRWAAMDWNACRHLLMVGPTGIGKTTTIAKLAGELVLRQGRRVVLATLDTYRVGAQDQLKAYADLLDIPCVVAATPAQLGELLAAHAAADVVLIDTAGRNPADAARVHELRGFCRAVPGIQVCLAVAANAGRAEFAAVVERFSTLPIAHTVVTKLDECAAAGRLYGCLRRHRLNVRWFTTGQEVPTDIVAAEPMALARQVIGA